MTFSKISQKKWSDRISNLATRNGQNFDKVTEDKLKKELVNMITDDISNYLSRQGIELLHNIGEKIKFNLYLTDR